MSGCRKQIAEFRMKSALPALTRIVGGVVGRCDDDALAVIAGAVDTRLETTVIVLVGCVVVASVNCVTAAELLEVDCRGDAVSEELLFPVDAAVVGAVDGVCRGAGVARRSPLH